MKATLVLALVCFVGLSACSTTTTSAPGSAACECGRKAASCACDKCKGGDAAHCECGKEMGAAKGHVHGGGHSCGSH